MAITLSASLQAAYDNITDRKPLLEISSISTIEGIPFSGLYLTEETTNETCPNSVLTSSGRIILIYKFGTNQLKFVYTDIERRIFYFETFDDDDLGYPSNILIDADLCQLSDGTIGVILITEGIVDYYIRYAIFSETGNLNSYRLIASYRKASVSSPNLTYSLASPSVIKVQNDTYLLTYIKTIYFVLTSSGDYTGNTNSSYFVKVTQDGSETTAYFQWRKDTGSWSASILCTGLPQLLAEGVYVTFPPGYFWTGQLFEIPVKKGLKASGIIWINNNPLEDNTAVIGGTTYTFKLVLTGAANEVLIDPLSFENTLQNLQCAITDTSYEGTGEGIRYGIGTVANTDVTATRSGIYLTLTALVAGEDGNDITIITDGARLINTGMAGGLDPTVEECIGSTASKIYKRTSSDFLTWSAEEEILITIGGTKNNCSIAQMNVGHILLGFDNYDDPLYANSYGMMSTDNGVTWEDPYALTEYDTPGMLGDHPIFFDRSSNPEASQPWCFLNETRTVLHWDKDDIGWGGGLASTIIAISVNEATNRVYAVAANTSYGVKNFYCVVEINTENAHITNAWNTETSPAFNQAYAENTIWWQRNHNEGKYVAIGTCENPGHIHIAVLDTEYDTVTNYNFTKWDRYGLAKNVEWEAWGTGSWTLGYTWIDETTEKLYVLLYSSYTYSRKIHIGTIDLSEIISGSDTYSFDTIVEEENEITERELYGVKGGAFVVNPESDIIIVSYSNTLADWSGRLRVYSISTGVLLHDYTTATKEQFPYRGLHSVYFRSEGNRVYGSFTYEDDFGEENKRGLCIIDLSTDTISFKTPTIATADEYQLQELVEIGDFKIAIATTGYGILIYDLTDNSWTQYNNENTPNLTEDGNDYLHTIAYEEDTGMIYAGVMTTVLTDWQGLLGINQYGVLSQAQYCESYGMEDGDYVFGSPSQLVLGIIDYDAVPAVDPDDNSLYAFWVNRVRTEYSIKWDRESERFDMMPYLVKQNEIILHESVYNEPKSITFTLSNGELFDPLNTLSLLRMYTLKGRTIKVRKGEIYSGVEYWQDVGIYYVNSKSFTGYEKGSPHLVTIVAKDFRSLIEDNQVKSTEKYETYGELVLKDVLETEDISSEDISLPVADDSETIYPQWINVKVKDILTDVCDFLESFHDVSYSNKFQIRKISDQNDVDHTYEDKKQFINLKFDDSTSDFTNRIIVFGEERLVYEVLLEEEQVATLSGTIGWWGCKKTHDVWYSEDLSRVCKIPRLEILESATNILFQLAGNVTEEISFVDSGNKYCTVNIEAPNLIPLLIAQIAGWIATKRIPDYVQVASVTGFGITIPFGRIFEGMALAGILHILASIGNYQYAIHAQPFGEYRRKIHAHQDATELQAEIDGKVIKKEINSSICYTLEQCQRLADHGIMLIRMQNKPVKISKIMHLQDRCGDTIEFPHLYTDLAIKIFITEITRRIKIPEGPNDAGYEIDDIEGWKISAY